MKNCTANDIREESLAYNVLVSTVQVNTLLPTKCFTLHCLTNALCLGYATPRRARACCTKLHPSRAIKQTKLDYVIVRNA